MMFILQMLWVLGYACYYLRIFLLLDEELMNIDFISIPGFFILIGVIPFAMLFPIWFVLGMIGVNVKSMFIKIIQFVDNVDIKIKLFDRI